MKLELMDYRNRKVSFGIGELADIASIQITVISGDEVATVMYKNGSAKNFDSSDERIQDFNDGSYTLYVADGTNHLEDAKWTKRKDSYSYFWL